MIDLQAFPSEIFDFTIEHLVATIGVHKAVRLRTVNKSFNDAILYAICVSQVVAIDDPATRLMLYYMDSTLRGKVLANRLRSASAVAGNQALSVISKVTQMLDTLTGETDLKRVNSWHASIAGAVRVEAYYNKNALVDAEVEAQNLLSGAAIIGNLSVVKSTLEHKKPASVNGRTTFFDHSLTLAAGRGHSDVVRYLLDCGARTEPLPDERDPIFNRADWNRLDCLERYLALSQGPPSALCAAIAGGHDDIVHLLLQPRFRIPTTSIEYMRAVIAGVRAGRLDLVEALLKVMGKTISDFAMLEYEMMWTAVQYDQKEILQVLIQRGVDINRCLGRHMGNLPTLDLAGAKGNSSMVRFLLERGADISLRGRSSQIGSAAQHGHEEVVDLLIEAGADPADALVSAAGAGQLRLIRSLLSRFPDLPHRKGGAVGRSAICNAIHCCNLTIMTLLVEAGVSLNGRDYNGAGSRLPLDKAKDYCGSWVVNHLISLGAHDTDQVTKPAPPRSSYINSIDVSERTWEWIGKY